MTLRNFSFGAAVALTMLGTGPVKAADLDPVLEDPVQDISAMPVSNVVFGSGWYARGDVAVTNAYKLGFGVPTANTFSYGLARSNDPSYSLSLGGGYAFTRYLRTDITVDFFQPQQALLYGLTCPITVTSTFCQASGRFSHYDALLNGYIDIGTWSIMTPYIGAGAGVGFGSVQAAEIGDTKTFTGHVGYQNFAFAGMAGVGVDIFPHVKLDVGYRYVNNGKVAGVEISHHEIRAGLRYMIDN